MNGTISTAFLAVSFACASFAAEDAVTTITRLTNESVKASLANTPDFFQKNYTDDFIGGTSFGEWETKSKIIKEIQDPKNKTNSMSIQNLKVKAYGDAGVARYEMKYDDMWNGEHRSRTILCTDTWVKQGGAWKTAASHCSKMK